jgi:FkbM family methyltransferase
MISKVARASALFRTAYGDSRGFLLWAELLKEKFCAAGQPFKVHVPGIQHPVWLRAKTSDLEVFCQIFGHREMGFFRSREARYIIDAGANIGLTSVLLANVCPSARIDALEVDGNNADLLRRNTAPYKNVRVIEKGLWRKTGFIKILNPDASAWAFRVGEAAGSDAGSIPAIGVADLLSASGFPAVDLLKVDIEGAEKEVFDSGASVWIQHVRQLAIELHDRVKPGCSDAVMQVVATRPHGASQSGEYHVFTFAERDALPQT